MVVRHRDNLGLGRAGEMLRRKSRQEVIEVSVGGASKYWRSFPLCQIRIDCCVATQVWRRLLFQTDELSASDVGSLGMEYDRMLSELRHLDA